MTPHVTSHIAIKTLLMIGPFWVMPQVCIAEVGDLRFTIADTTIYVNRGIHSFGIDVLLAAQEVSELPARGWGMVNYLTPQPGSTGSVRFDPLPIVDNAPNLPPSSTNPFLDFDRDFSGMSYGELGSTSTEMISTGSYLEPTLGPPPLLDSLGNLTLPSGSGLVSLPLVASEDATGEFLISFDPNPLSTGVFFNTGLPQPDDASLHPVGVHSTATLTLVNVMSDYSLNGIVDAADYTVWRDALGTSVLNPGDGADGNRSGLIDAGDYDVWELTFGQILSPLSLASTVPEPNGGILAVLGLLPLGIHYRYRVHNHSRAPR